MGMDSLRKAVLYIEEHAGDTSDLAELTRATDSFIAACTSAIAALKEEIVGK